LANMFAISTGEELLVSNLDARTRGIFESDVLPALLARSRWFPGRDPTLIQPTLQAAMPFSESGDSRPWLAFVEAKIDNVAARYLLPFQIAWVSFDGERQNSRAVAAVRQGTREGTLMDVATDHEFVALFLRNLQKSLVIEESGVRLAFNPTTQFPFEQLREPDRVRAVATEQSNSTALVDTDYVVKIYRKLEAGINPEIEMSRFLTENTDFLNTPALLGTCELVESDRRSAIGVVHRFVENEGDGWTVSSGYLDRFIDEQKLTSAAETHQSEQWAPYLRLISQTGRRLAEMHLALGSRPDIPDFAPDSVRPEDVTAWTSQIKARTERIFELFTTRRSVVRARDLELVNQFLTLKDHLDLRLNALLPKDLVARKIRHHGDFHLGQMLVAKEDVFIIDFEGEPKRTFAERRQKMPAARDVAGLIRSLDYSVMGALNRSREAGATPNNKLERAMGLWRNQAVQAFLATYREGMSGSSLWPTDNTSADSLLRFFLLEKALYEVEYELAYRPDWIRVPLKGTIEILFGSGSA
jgi:maltose alpha-D-glucosyltransferase / alpha-amylase